MLDGLRNHIIAQLKKREQHSEEELYVFLTSFIANLFCLVVHGYFLVLFLVAGHWWFAGLNAVSVAVYVVNTTLYRRRAYKAATLITSLEVTVYATIFGFFTGIATYIVGFLVLVIILQALIPYASGKFRVGVVALQVVCAVALVSHHILARPAFPFSNRMYNILLASHIAVLFVGSMAELYLSNVVRIMVAELNRLRMAELTDRANMDPLTGLHNRHYAADYFARLAKGGKACCVAMLDVDDFKQVNDKYGHVMGDKLLVQLAEHLGKNLRRSDAIFRWGGDEFLVVLEDTTLPIAQNVLCTLHQGLGALQLAGTEEEVMLSVTIGVAQLRPGDMEACIKESDHQLYRGKQAGKNRVMSVLVL